MIEELQLTITYIFFEHTLILAAIKNYVNKTFKYSSKMVYLQKLLTELFTKLVQLQVTSITLYFTHGEAPFRNINY